MKLVKAKWEFTKLNQICDLLNGYAFKNSDYVAHSNTLNLRMSNIKINGGFDIEYEKRFLPDDFINKYPRFIVKDGDLVIAMTDMANDPKILGVPTIVKNSRAYNLLLNQRVGKIVDIKTDKINLDYLIFYLSKPEVRDYYKSISKKGVQINISKQDILSCDVILPPLEEQKQIAALFQSLETAIEHVDGQEKNLKGLRTKLINGLTKEQPKFGNLITSKCKKVCVEDVAEEMSERVDNPSKSEYERFVGLEEFQSGEMKIQKWISTDKLVSAMKLFKNGDVLFARRNVYLKRVSQVDFDGICSGDAIVMRVNKNIIYPEFLTLILNTNEFWDYALTNAAGAFSKRIKWRELAIYTFEIPELKTQEKILEVFNQLETTLSLLNQQKIALKNLKQKLLNEILG